MQFNQLYRLIFRKDKLIASQIDGQSAAMYLNHVDLCLIDFVESKDQQSIEQFLKQDSVSSLNPGLNSAQINTRLNQLNASNILVNNSIASDSTNAFDLNQIELTEDQLPNKCTVSKHMAFNRINGMWHFWSAPFNKMIQCDTKQLVILSEYLNSKRLDKTSILLNAYAAEEFIEQTLKGFYISGVLINADKVPNLNPCDSTEFTPSQQIEQSSWWQNIEPDESRIPIYFVPHMKNHYPLALGVLYSAIQNYNEGELLSQYQLVPINFLEPKDLFNGPYQKFGTGIWLFSNYMWSLDVNMMICDIIKKHNPANITIHGGPSTPDYPQADKEFMENHPGVDISVHGEGEICITQILGHIDRNDQGQLNFLPTLKNVEGITFRQRSANKPFVRTPKRQRTATPDSVPSPYLTGCFDGYGVDVEAAIIESNRGCPFGCTFCDWGSATNQKVRKFELQRVKDEIDWIAANQIRVLWIADANYGLYDRDIELAKYIVESKQKTGYPEEVVVNYTKNSTWRLVEIIKIFNEGGIISQGIISIQTTDEKTLEVINRKNIKTEKYDELTKVFYDLKLPLSTDLMMGLPGITVEGFNKDLQKYIDMDVSIKAYPTQLLPNSPMADPEYMEKYQIKTDKNDFLIGSFSYTEQDLKWMKAMYHMYTIADGYGLLRYVIRYMQWEHDVPAVDFMSDLLKYVNKNPSHYQQITWAIRYFIGDKTMPGGWHNFYQQVKNYIVEQYGLSVDSGFETVFLVSQYCMPDDTLDYPMRLKVPHDFTAYFSAKRQTNDSNKEFSLMEYPPANFMVSDPNNMVHIDMDYLQYDSHQYFWELQTPVSRPKSSSEFSKEKSTAEQ